MKKCKRVLPVSVLFVLMFFCCVNGTRAAEKSITAKGVSQIENDDVSMARDRAISDALKKAVEMAVGSEIHSETVMENYELLNEKIYSKSEGYVKNYSVVDEKREENLYWVTIQADVSSKILRDDLSAIGLLMAQKKMPRILIMIAEQNLGFHAFTVYQSGINQAEQVFINALRERSFHLIDANTIRQVVEKEAAMKALNGDDNTASIIARKAGADILITGKASAEGGGKIANSSMHTCSANLSVRAVRADTAEIIASGTESAVKPHINKQTGSNLALEEAAKKLSETIIQQILSRWQQDVYDSNKAALFIASIDHADVHDFSELVKRSVRGVQNVYIREISGNSASLDVTVKGDASDLARELQKLQFKNKKIVLLEQTLNKVHVTLQ